MRTFFVNKLDSTGFEMRNLGKIANAEKQRAKDLFAKNKRIVVTTSIEVTQPIPIYILSNGFYYGPHDLKITGYWAWSETMATLLPYDYVP